MGLPKSILRKDVHPTAVVHHSRISAMNPYEAETVGSRVGSLCYYLARSILHIALSLI